MPMAGVLTASTAWADVTITDTTDTVTDSRPQQTIRPTLKMSAGDSEETCEDVD